VADELTVGDVVGSIGPPKGIPTPAKIKPGSATVVAYAMIEEALDANLMDDSTWTSFWETRGATRLSTMLWAYVNQDAFADGREEDHTLRRCQAAITASTLHAYLLAILRAFGQDDFAVSIEKLLAEQKRRLQSASEDITLDAAGMPVLPDDAAKVEAAHPLVKSAAKGKA